MKNFLFVIMLGYVSVFSGAVFSSGGSDHGNYNYGCCDDDDNFGPDSHGKKPVLWGLYTAESFLKTLVALFGTGVVVYIVTPHAFIGAVTGYCIYYGSPHIRALRGALIYGGLAACVYSPRVGIMLYDWSRGNVEGGSD
ncbi:hypothetical protein [Endozoicomonas sp. 2B-B]